MKLTTINTARLVLLLVAFLPLLTTLGFQLRQQAVRNKMKEELEKQFLHTITANENDFHWVEKGEELWVNDHLFDVQSYTCENGTYTFTGLYDEEETLLVKQVEETQGQHNTPANKFLSALFQLLNGVIDDQQEDIPELAPVSSIKAIEDKDPLWSQYITITTPPPKA